MERASLGRVRTGVGCDSGAAAERERLRVDLQVGDLRKNSVKSPRLGNETDHPVQDASLGRVGWSRRVRVDHEDGVKRTGGRTSGSIVGDARRVGDSARGELLSCARSSMSRRKATKDERTASDGGDVVEADDEVATGLEKGDNLRVERENRFEV